MMNELELYVLSLSMEIHCLIIFALAVLAGAVIGGEREKKGKEGGIRTHTFVITGAALITLVATAATPHDPGKIVGTIISGIGFLGAGMIMKNDTKVSNLTSAAEIWYSAAIGMTLGFKYYLIALLALLFAAIIVRMPNFQKSKSNM